MNLERGQVLPEKEEKSIFSEFSEFYLYQAAPR